MKTNTYYKHDALAALNGNWSPAVLATVVFLLCTLVAVLPSEIPLLTGTVDEMTALAQAGDIEGVMSLNSRVMSWSSLGLLLEIFLYSVLSLGFTVACLRLLRSGDNRLTSNMFEIAFRNYWHKLWGLVLMYIFIILWSLLLIIPGIVKSFSYAMTPFILEENPELSANEAIDRSRAMMKGHKFDLFWLFLSFLGWLILGIFTLGIGYLWLIPYMQTAVASFYEDVKADYELNGGLI